MLLRFESVFEKTQSFSILTFSISTHDNFIIGFGTSISSFLLPVLVVHPCMHLYCNVSSSRKFPQTNTWENSQSSGVLQFTKRIDKIIHLLLKQISNLWYKNGFLFYNEIDFSWPSRELNDSVRYSPYQPSISYIILID